MSDIVEGGMSGNGGLSDMRDRIAAAIYGAASQWDAHPWDALAGHVQAAYCGQADAVIEALQLQPEYGHLDETDSGIIADTINELGKPCPGETLRQRHITPWKDINEVD